MIYLDTNVLVYAFLKNVDDEKQKDIAISILQTALENDELLISEITLYEFAFVSKKLGEEVENIDKYLDFLSKFSRNSNQYIQQRSLEIISKSSFDIAHLSFAEYYDVDRFVTFDKGFKKLQKFSKIQIEIL